ncbi:MAG: hypothetical protein CL840_11285 [Crocinitomicaceae bacterium]|nr:hypothetical protein [Crocinitomicaceae bacterium]
MIIGLLLGAFIPLNSYSQKKKPLIDLEKERKFVVLPSIYYTPETRWAFGAVAIGFFRFNNEDTISPMSNASMSFAYTMNDQILFQAPFNLYFKKDKFRILGEVAYYNYPYFFSGVGNEFPLRYSEDYVASFPRIQLAAMQKVWKNWYTGPRVFLQNTTMEEVAQGGLLDSGIVPGSQGGLANAIGWEVRIDGRDNVYAPRKGYYLRTGLLAFDKIVGSDFDFNHFDIDARLYYNLGKNHVLAAQSYSEFNFGNTPFNRMAQLGGSKIMRGYKKGTYRDQLMTAVQLEYRTPIWHFFGFTAFVGTGGVADKFSNFSTEYLRPSYGAGLRLAFNKKERIHIRLDYARGDHYEEFYITLNEAF